jgi:hypothetical protein
MNGIVRESCWLFPMDALHVQSQAHVQNCHARNHSEDSFGRLNTGFSTLLACVLIALSGASLEAPIDVRARDVD